MKNIFILLAAIFTINIANAQWQQTNGPDGGVWINCIAVNGNSMYAGTYGNGIYLSTNNGASWTAINNGLSNRNIATFMFSGNTILAGGGNNSSGESSNGIMISTNNGNSWTMVNDSILKLLAIYAFALKDSSILALTNSGLFTSNDNGNNWTMINSDFPSSVDVSSIAINGNNIFVGTLANGVLLSTNNGSNWVAMNTGLTNTEVTSLLFHNDTIYAGTYGDGVFMSTDNANTWTSFSSGITNGWVQTLAIKGDTIFAGSNYSGIFSTALNENNWIADTIGLIYNNVVTIASNGNNIYAGGNGIYLSTDNGISWNPAINGFADININDIAVKDNKIVVSSPNGVYESTNNGDNWSSIGLTGFQIYTIGISDSNIFAQYYYQQIHHPFDIYSTVYLTSNNGNNWTAPNLGFDYLNELVKSGNNIYAATNVGVFMLTKNGNSWNSLNIGLVNINVSTLAIKGNTIYAGTTSNGVFMSSNNGATWVSKNNGLTDTIVSSLAIIGDTIFAGISYHYTYNPPFSIYRSTDNGNSWSLIITGLPDSTYIRSIITKGNAIFALTGKGVYLSTNNGNNWSSINSGIPSNVLISSIAIDDNYIFAGTIRNSVWKRKLSDVLLPESANSISGITNVCKPQNSVTYTVPAISYATSYLWTLPNGIIDTTSTNSITISIDSTFISGFIKVKGINICGQGNENTIYLNVTNVPLTPYIIGLPNPQPFSSELYSVSQQLGKIYNWTVTDGNIINGLGTNYINVQWGNTGIGKVSISIADSNNTNCTSSSNLIVNIGNVGIETLESDKVVNIYPNPASSELTIETNSNLELRIEIINFIGQTVYSTNINKRATLDISLLQKGIYILKLNTCKEIIVRKFIKE